MLFHRTLWVLMHPATFLLASTTALIAVGGALWQQHAAEIRAAQAGAAGAVPVRITPPSSWASEGLDRQVVAGLQQLRQPIEHPETVSQVARALLSMGPIERVHRVSKSSRGIDVDCRWREPVAVVRTSGGLNRLVDRDGMLFDRQIPDDEAQGMLAIRINAPGGDRIAAWQVWDDPRVIAAAGIAAEISRYWRDWGVYRIVTFRNPPGFEPNVGAYLLWTAGGAKVIWSDQGGKEDPALVARRCEAISRWIQLNGPLDSLAGRMILDVRTGVANLIPEQRDARLPEWLDGIR